MLSALAICYACRMSQPEFRFLRKLHNRREPPGLEWTVLKRLPMALLGSTLVPVFVALGGRILPYQGAAMDAAKHVKHMDITAIALAITLWTAVLTVAIGCVVVIVMKGPAYVADPYYMEKPKRDGEQREQDG